MASQLQFNLVPERKIWTVSELTGRIRELLTAAFPGVWVEGEISNFRDASPAQFGVSYLPPSEDETR